MILIQNIERGILDTRVSIDLPPVLSRDIWAIQTIPATFVVGNWRYRPLVTKVENSKGSSDFTFKPPHYELSDATEDEVFNHLRHALLLRAATCYLILATQASIVNTGPKIYRYSQAGLQCCCKSTSSFYIFIFTSFSIYNEQPSLQTPRNYWQMSDAVALCLFRSVYLLFLRYLYGWSLPSPWLQRTGDYKNRVGACQLLR